MATQRLHLHNAHCTCRRHRTKCISGHQFSVAIFFVSLSNIIFLHYYLIFMHSRIWLHEGMNCAMLRSSMTFSIYHLANKFEIWPIIKILLSFMGHFDGCNFEHVKQFRIEGNKKKTHEIFSIRGKLTKSSANGCWMINNNWKTRLKCPLSILAWTANGEPQIHRIGKKNYNWIAKYGNVE